MASPVNGDSWPAIFEAYTGIRFHSRARIGPSLAAILLASTHRPPTYRALLLASWLIFAGCAAAVWVSRPTPLYNLGPHPAAGLFFLAALIWEWYPTLDVFARRDDVAASC